MPRGLDRDQRDPWMLSASLTSHLPGPGLGHFSFSLDQLLMASTSDFSAHPIDTPSTPGTTSSPAHPLILSTSAGVTACSQAFCSESLVFLCFSAGGCGPTYFLIALCPETVRSGPACPKPTFLICAIPLIPPACTPNSCSTNPGRKAVEYRTVLKNNLPCHCV